MTMTWKNKLALATMSALFGAAGFADEEPVELVPSDSGEAAWRFDIGVRAAPRFKTSATIDPRAAARVVGGVAVPHAPSAKPSPERSSSRVSTRRDTGTETTKSERSSTTTTSAESASPVDEATSSGTSREEAMASSGYSGASRYDFDNGYIDMADLAGIPGETTNWRFDGADAYDPGGPSITGVKRYGETTVATHTEVRTATETTTETVRTTRSRTSTETTTATKAGVVGGGVSSAVAERFLDTLSDDSRETEVGLDLRLSRTLWENDQFGLELGIGYTLYRDIDCFHVAGRVYEGLASTTRRGTTRTVETTNTRRTTTATEVEETISTRATTSTTTTRTTTTTTDSGAIRTVIAQPEFTDIADIQNPDGTIGGGSFDGLPVHDGWMTPILVVTSDRFSVVDQVDAPVSDTATQTEETVSSSESSGKPTRTRSETSSTASSKRRTSERGSDATTSVARSIDVKSQGELSLQELRLGMSPLWKATPWLRIRADLGVVVSYATVDVDTQAYANGERCASWHHTDDDWKTQGYAGLSLAVKPRDWLELSAGVESRFPSRTIHFDDGIVSGDVELAKWDAFVAVGVRF